MSQDNATTTMLAILTESAACYAEIDNQGTLYGPASIVGPGTVVAVLRMSERPRAGDRATGSRGRRKRGPRPVPRCLIGLLERRAFAWVDATHLQVPQAPPRQEPAYYEIEG